MNIERTALEDVAALLHQKAGLKIGPDGLAGLRLALTARLAALRESSGRDYVHLLRGPQGDTELRALLPLVTVGKTDFFRDERQFDALARTVLPRILTLCRREGRVGRIWSAGCATGEEPYSVSMLLAELGANDDEVEVIATDLNPAAVERAKRGDFPVRRMAGVSGLRRDRFFEPTGEGFRVRPSISKRVRFSVHNLANPLWGDLGVPRSIDLILCRNVIIYFGIETIRRVMDRFHDVLRPDGFLFLGYSESLFKVYDRFRMVEVDGAYVYRPAGAVPSAAVLPAPPAPRTTYSWERRMVMAPLTPAPASPRPTPPPAPALSRAPDDRIREVTRDLEQGGFIPAREKLERWLAQDPDQLGALLTLGNLFGLTGEPARARECFERVLAREPLCADAHVFGALAAFQANQFEDARTELTRALFLEPTLALAHYLLAQVLERVGDPAGARRGYRNAISQLRSVQRPLAGFYPDSPEPDAIGRAARYALAALEERAG